jgi:uncharacterized phiE125 gp8 family phage protein
MNLIVIAEPATEPVSTETAKTHLRVDGAADDVLIDGYLITAREVCEGLARRAFITQTLALVFDAWPAVPLEFPRPPLISVTSVKYKDADGVEHTMSSGDYIVDARTGRMTLADGASWPSVKLYPISAITITFSAGYGTEANVPKKYKTAILMLTAHWYENREVVSDMVREIPMGVRTLLKHDRERWF